MRSSSKYVVGTTFLMDCFVNEDPNVQRWYHDISSSNTDIIITSVVLLEFIKNLYYREGYSRKKIRKAIKLLTRMFKSVKIVNLDERTVKDISKKLHSLPKTPELHAGELSFLDLLSDPAMTVVSSDGGVLRSYVNVDRTDPRKNPPELPAGRMP